MKKFRTLTHIYFLEQKEELTTIERMNIKTELTYKATINKNIEEITKEDILSLEYKY